MNSRRTHGHPVSVRFLDGRRAAGGADGTRTVTVVAGRSDAVVTRVGVELLLVAAHRIGRTG